MIVYLFFEIKIYTILLDSLKKDNTHIRIQRRKEKKLILKNHKL